ncbi:MAG TPA: hypothetical protein DCE41_19835 [Cytophagales bacterium]|nr:hypothetical protein [Cytophagales bacterium]HAA19360.1 hypothetical protein [Cytophagales bacterium]HAP64958.1 hypothetical protein [Cytophagales bacterium]
MDRYRPIIIGVTSLLGLITLLALVGFMLPSSYQVERTILIHAPLDTVFNTIQDMRHWEAWSPWSESDDEMTVHFSDKTTGEGAWQHWTSETMGSGMMQFTEVVEGQVIKYKMEFEVSNESTEGWFHFEEVPEGVRLTWGDQGKMDQNPVQRYMGLFMGSIMGSDFEQGLANIKEVCE